MGRAGRVFIPSSRIAGLPNNLPMPCEYGVVRAHMHQIWSCAPELVQYVLYDIESKNDKKMITPSIHNMCPIPKAINSPCIRPAFWHSCIASRQLWIEDWATGCRVDFQPESSWDFFIASLVSCWLLSVKLSHACTLRSLVTSAKHCQHHEHLA